jgi:hypothetical protein
MRKIATVLAVMITGALCMAAVRSASRIARANDNRLSAVLSLAPGPAIAFEGALAGLGVSEPQHTLSAPFPALATALAQSAQPDGLAAQTIEGFADLNPINRSGIRALINVKKIGQTETITGFATNMDPYKAYVSLFSDAGSPGSGPCACMPSNPAPAAVQATCKTTGAPPVNFSQMMVGYWLPLIGSTTRTLHVLKAGAADSAAPQAFAPLDHIGSISVREDTQLGQPLPAAPDTNRFQLRACGKFRLDQD